MAKSARFRNGIVLDDHDPESAGRVRVRVGPEGRSRAHVEVWARLTAPSAGAGHGVWFPPEVGDEVLVAFQGGKADEAYVVGALWGAGDNTPAPEVKTLQTRSGLTVTLDDAVGRETIRLATPGGQHLTLQDGVGSLTLTDGQGNMLRFDGSGLTIEAAAKVRIEASLVELSAAVMSVGAGMASFAGVVQCDTLIANNVIATSYTPGQGNLQ